MCTTKCFKPFILLFSILVASCGSNETSTQQTEQPGIKDSEFDSSITESDSLELQISTAPTLPTEEVSRVAFAASSSASSYLLQEFWRGDEGWRRTVPIINNEISWNAASGWQGPIQISTLPGKGSMENTDGFIVGNQLLQSFWRGGEGWLRYVPVIEGVVQWNSANAWQGPITLNNMPGRGILAAASNVVVGDQLVQSIWRGEEGWFRYVPINQEIIEFSNAGKWQGPLNISGYPGQGSMETLSSFILKNKHAQAFWRGGEGWYREVPIVDGVTRWEQAEQWRGPIPKPSLPGKGAMQTASDIVIIATNAGDAGQGISDELDLSRCSLKPIELEAITKIFYHERQQRGALSCNPILQQVALEKAKDMGTRIYFSHVNPDGFGPNYLAEMAGYPLASEYGNSRTDNYIESIALNYPTGEAVMTAWANSPSHAFHIFGEGDFTRRQNEFGIAYYHSPVNGGKYWVILIARQD